MMTKSQVFKLIRQAMGNPRQMPDNFWLEYEETVNCWNAGWNQGPTADDVVKALERQNLNLEARAFPDYVDMNETIRLWEES